MGTDRGDDVVAGEPPPGSSPIASVAIRRGLSGAFADFDLLPALLGAVEDGCGREAVTRVWASYLTRAGFEHRHLDLEQLPEGLSAADSIAADVWRFAARMGWVAEHGLTAAGRYVRGLGEREGTVRGRLARTLSPRVDQALAGENGVRIVPLLERGAVSLAGTKNLWARECPGLLPIEVGAIIHWACVKAARARELVDNLVSWRDAAMHRHGPPDPRAMPGENPTLHFDVVSEFYDSHAWLAGALRTSFAEDLAIFRLLAFCGAFREVPLAPSVSCLAPGRVSPK